MFKQPFGCDCDSSVCDKEVEILYHVGWDILKSGFFVIVDGCQVGPSETEVLIEKRKGYSLYWQPLNINPSHRIVTLPNRGEILRRLVSVCNDEDLIQVLYKPIAEQLSKGEKSGSDIATAIIRTLEKIVSEGYPYWRANKVRRYIPWWLEALIEVEYGSARTEAKEFYRAWRHQQPTMASTARSLNPKRRLLTTLGYYLARKRWIYNTTQSIKGINSTNQ